MVGCFSWPRMLPECSFLAPECAFQPPRSCLANPLTRTPPKGASHTAVPPGTLSPSGRLSCDAMIQPELCCSFSTEWGALHGRASSQSSSDGHVRNVEGDRLKPEEFHEVGRVIISGGRGQSQGGGNASFQHCRRACRGGAGGRDLNTHTHELTTENTRRGGSWRRTQYLEIASWS